MSPVSGLYENRRFSRFFFSGLSVPGEPPSGYPEAEGVLPPRQFAHIQIGSEEKDCCCDRLALIGLGCLWMWTTASPKSASCTG